MPVRVEYRLTDKGSELRPVYDAIGRWAHRWMAGGGEVMPECFAEQGPEGSVMEGTEPGDPRVARVAKA